ncbi:MAG: HIT family protein [Desulfohalobiaceae bacterium]
MQDCIFCKIVAGEIPSSVVYTDANLLAFLDVNPIAPGHTLLVSRAHYSTVFELPRFLAEEMLLAMQNVGQAVMQAVQAEGLNLLMNNHRPAGQLIFHAHWHLIPRKSGDGLLSWEQGAYASQEAMQSIAQEIRGLLPGREQA